jgi:chromosome segregation ATPase
VEIRGCPTRREPPQNASGLSPRGPERDGRRPNLQEAIRAAAATAKAEVASQLAHAQREATELAEAGEALEAEQEALRDQVRSATSELDSLRGRATEQAAELQRLEAELARERAAGETARLDAAQLRRALEEIRAVATERNGELEQMRAHMRDEQQARTKAERELAVAEAAKRNLDERLREHQEYEQVVGRELTEQRARVAEVLERERDALTLAAKREGELRSELAHCQGKLLLVEAKLQ